MPWLFSNYRNPLYHRETCKSYSTKLPDTTNPQLTMTLPLHHRPTTDYDITAGLFYPLRGRAISPWQGQMFLVFVKRLLSLDWNHVESHQKDISSVLLHKSHTKPQKSSFVYSKVNITLYNYKQCTFCIFQVLLYPQNRIDSAFFLMLMVHLIRLNKQCTYSMNASTTWRCNINK